MSSQSLLSRLVTTVSANVLRAVGSLVIVLSVGVAAASVSTDYALGGDPTGGTAAYTVDVGAVTALVEFAAAHPAYPVFTLIGLVLVVAGEETPLLGS